MFRKRISWIANKKRLDNMVISLPSVIILPTCERANTVDLCARPASKHVSEAALAVTDNLPNDRMETFPVKVVTMVKKWGFYRYMGTINSTQTLWKIPLSLEPIYHCLKVYTPWKFTDYV